MFSSLLQSQPFSEDQFLQGYAHSDDQLTFLFSEEMYEVSPGRVVVTGAFRNWDQNMEEERWQLEKKDFYWVLTVDNPNFELIPPATHFKFRIDNGEWMDPPMQAVNQSGGNLVFLQGFEVPSLRAELRNPYLIWAEVHPNRPLLPEAYRLTDAAGNELPIAGVLPHEGHTVLVRPEEPIDLKRVYFLEIPDQDLKVHCSFDGWFREVYSTKALGANIENGITTLRLFAPRAESVWLHRYHERDDQEPYGSWVMVPDTQGVWEIAFAVDLHGTYYDFTLYGPDEPGNHFYETNPVHVTDPYARVSDDTWGKARIWRQTEPATPLKGGIPKLEDVIAYEVHVQDFTDRLPVGEELKGRFPAMIEPGLTNSRGEKIGFDYLVDLGINVVHLMPVQEYVHFPTDDWKASFQDDPYMISQGVSEENYQWGYRTSHAMAVESRYRSLGKEPGAEREEFRDLVQAFHDKGIAVIIDIVPNHTAENMDGNNWFFNFNAIDKLYYYRTKDFEHIGAYGNEVKTEDRPMVQRWIIDQCLHFINEFGIDGFRIDLAGQIDQQTLLALKEAIGQDKILYGEPWIGSNDPNYENNPDWDWYKEDSPITFFQDDARNAFKGPVFELNSKQNDRGWPGGKFDERERVMKGLANHFPEDKTPLSGINYLDIHDNFALADQFGSKNFDGRLSVDQDIYKIAVTLLYTSLGPIVTHGGSEIMRSKAHAPLGEVVKETQAGYKVYMHGYRDTYNHRTANQFDWETVGQEPNDTNANDYRNMYAFWKGLNAFRLSDYGKVFRVAERVPKGYFQWITPANEALLGYMVDEQILVLLNAEEKANTFTNIKLPEGNWKLIANTKEIDHVNGVRDREELSSLTGGQSIRIGMEPTSLRIWVKE